MTVRRVHYRDDGWLEARVEWHAVPDLLFELELRPNGEVAAVTARALGGSPVVARQLRLAPVGQMQRAIRASVRADSKSLGNLIVDERGNELDPESLDWFVEQRHLVTQAMKSFEDDPRPGAAGRGDEHYAAIAARYVDILDDPLLSDQPVGALAAELGIKSRAVSNMLYKARERGLLTTAGRGKAGGLLTDKAKEILRGE